jgi:hypothetical protein
MQTLVERGCGLDEHQATFGGLFIDGFKEQESSQTDSDVMAAFAA